MKDTLIKIEELLLFAKQHKMIEPDDIEWTRNSIYSYLRIPAEHIDELVFFESSAFKNAKNYEYDVNTFATATAVLSVLIDDFSKRGNALGWLDAGLTSDMIDRIEAGIMNLLMPRPSEVSRKFYELYEKNKEHATNYFYNLSRASNYIQVDRVNKNVKWITPTMFGDLQITINVSKPEKDPRDIAASRNKPQAGYPKCLLCAENIGFEGTHSHPARQNLRTLPIMINGEDWLMQYSPYVYYNEHSIIFNAKHVPMRITKATFKKLLSYVQIFPHYFVGSNADLPIVGGSILSHDHFQGGNHTFPIQNAKTIAMYECENNPDVKISRVMWPLSVVRIASKNVDALIKFASHVLDVWSTYTDKDANIISHTEDTPHNTITPIARKNDRNEFELDLVLRNNRTSDEFPMGIFHAHEKWHHIKKENIGLIEVMGLAVLPARLAESSKEIIKILSGSEYVIGPDSSLSLHKEWIDELVMQYGNANDPVQAEKIVQKEIGNVFLHVLEDCGVFKNTDNGHLYFEKFMSCLTQGDK